MGLAVVFDTTSARVICMFNRHIRYNIYGYRLFGYFHFLSTTVATVPVEAV
jgi:hypothetical protein